MANKFYQLNEEQKKKLAKMISAMEANNEGYRLAAKTFSEFQTELLIEKDEFYKEISKLMNIDWKAISRSGHAIRIEEGVAKIVKLNPEKEEVKNV